MGRHIAQGILKAWWVVGSGTPIAAKAAPTLTELGTNGVDLLGTKAGEALMDIRGFKPQASVYQTEDYIDAIAGNVGGTSQYPQSSMMFYSDLDSTTIRDALAQGETGEIVIGHVGSGVGDESQVFDASILFNEYDPSKGQAVPYEVAFGISAPTKGVFAS